ncbi:MAG: outer membrane protein assembly factor BamE [Gammaproteobacteria bacterium]|nr:outer membrane protein assembly factor BamE [Gammaproteobacteria bacterium]
MRLRKLLTSIIIIASALLSGCGEGGLFHVYKIDIPQGNLLADEKIQQLKPGLTKRQVLFLLGKPAINDVFHANRWDYVYQYRYSSEDRTVRRKLSLIFAGDVLSEINGDVSSRETEI